MNVGEESWSSLPRPGICQVFLQGPLGSVLLPGPWEVIAPGPGHVRQGSRGQCILLLLQTLGASPDIPMDVCLQTGFLWLEAYLQSYPHNDQKQHSNTKKI